MGTSRVQRYTVNEPPSHASPEASPRDLQGSCACAPSLATCNITPKRLADTAVAVIAQVSEGLSWEAWPHLSLISGPACAA